MPLYKATEDVDIKAAAAELPNAQYYGQAEVSINFIYKSVHRGYVIKLNC